MTLVSDTMEAQGSAEQSGDLERRRGLRIRQSRPVKLFEPSAARYYAGQTRDVSTTGLQLELPAGVPVVPGRVLSIHVGVDGQGQPLANRRQMMPARVVWVDRAGHVSPGGRITAGVELLASLAAEMDAA